MIWNTNAWNPLKVRSKACLQPRRKNPMARSFDLNFMWLIRMATAAVLATLTFQLSAAAPPNIILILTDDHGWTSTATEMDKANPASRSDFYETPSIDRLARSGMRFSQGYAPAAICTPTRRSILFGQTQFRQGVDEGFDERYDPYEKGYLTIPLMLKAAHSAYRAAHFGKWHQKTGAFSPEDFGFDQSDGRTSNADGTMFEYKDDKWKNVFITGDPKRSDRISGRGASFIRRNAAAATPFFLQLSYYATHVDIQAKEETYHHFSSKPRGRGHDHPGFAAMLKDLDTGIGSVLDAVEATGIADNTFIIFMADNGGAEFFPPSRFKLAPQGTNGRPQHNDPLRGGKWVLYEGGIRVPFVISGPGITAGSQSDVPVVGYDLLPTLAELAGYPSAMPSTVDGGSFVPLLDDGRGEVRRPQPAIFHHREAKNQLHSAIRMGDYKLVKFWKKNYAWGPRIELYNLAEDIGEAKDLAGQMPEKARQMEQVLLTYLESIDAELLTRVQ